VVGEQAYGTFRYPLRNLTISIFPLSLQNVTVREEGLPNGTSWTVNVSGGSTYVSTSNVTTFRALNGSYSFVVSSGNSTFSAPGGRFTVNGTGASANVTFSRLTVTPRSTATPVDEGQTIVITAGASGGSGNYTSYVWTGLPAGCAFPGNVSSFTCTPQMGTASPSPYVISVTVADSLGAQVTAAFDLVVAPAMQATPSAVENPTDAGQPTTISAGAAGGSGVFTAYRWGGLPDGCSGSGPSFTCRPTTPGTFDVWVNVSDSNGGDLNSSFIFEISPVLDAGVASAAKNPIDVGQQTSISVSGVTGGTGAYTYTWSGLPLGCANPGNVSSFTCVPAATGDYVVAVIVSDSTGTEAHTTFTMTVNADPTVDWTPSVATRVLQGREVTLSVTSTPGSGGLTYVWSGLPQGCTSANTATISCNPSTVGTYNLVVTVTDSDGCRATTSALRFTVNPSFMGLPAVEGYALVVGAAVAVCVAGIVTGLLLARRRRARGPST